jgi:hypothetical protein
VRPECPFLQLTTLDEHRDAKQVTTNDPYTHEPSY